MPAIPITPRARNDLQRDGPEGKHFPEEQALSARGVLETSGKECFQHPSNPFPSKRVLVPFLELPGPSSSRRTMARRVDSFVTPKDWELFQCFPDSTLGYWIRLDPDAHRSVMRSGSFNCSHFLTATLWMCFAPTPASSSEDGPLSRPLGRSSTTMER